MARAKKPALEVEIPRSLFKAAAARMTPMQTIEDGITIPDRSAQYDYVNGSFNGARNWRNRTEMMRFLARYEGPISTAVHNFVQTANNGYKLRTYDMGTNTFSAEGTALAMNMMGTFDTPVDYSNGFSDKMTTETLIETMMREAILTYGVGAELVLNDTVLADRINVIPLETIGWKAKGEGKKARIIPIQYQNNQKEPVELDIPTFFVQRMAGDPGMLHCRSMLESSVKLLVYLEEFMDDVRRVVRQSGHARQVVSLDIEKAINTAPADVKSDKNKLSQWLSKMQSEVQTYLESIRPEDALVLFSTAEFKIESPSFGAKIDYTPMLDMIAGMTAMSAKTPPSALGMRLDGSSNVASVETTMFLKSAKAIQTPTEAVMSRALTLGCRLFGANVRVDFSFDPLDLRPEIELESFYTMKQQRVMQDLSYGFLSDDEAAVELGRFPRPAGAPKLSGTMFVVNKGQAGDLPINPGDTPVGKAQQPSKTVPRKAGGDSQ